MTASQALFCIDLLLVLTGCTRRTGRPGRWQIAQLGNTITTWREDLS